MSEKSPEHIPPQEVIKENKNLLYVINDTWKHLIGSAEGRDWDTNINERARIQDAAASVLWRLRGHPHYFAYPDSPEHKLADHLGNLPTDSKVINIFERRGRETTIDDFYIRSRLAQDESYGKEKGTAIKIPEMEELVRRGILTDVVSAAGKKILLEAMQKPHYQKGNRILAERAGIPVDEFKGYSIARLNYGLYTIGYLLPWMKPGSESAKFIEQKIIKGKIDDPADYLKQNFGLDIVI